MVKFVKTLFVSRINPAIYLVTFIVLSLPFSCIDNRNKVPDIQQASFLLRYMTQNRELYAEVVFKTDSTYRFEKEVSFDSEPMMVKKLPIVGWQYRLTQDRVNFKNAYTFDIPIGSSTSTQVDVSLPTMTNIRLADQQISKEKGGRLQWEGSPSEEGMGIYLLLTDSLGNTIQTSHIGKSKETSVPVFPLNLQTLQPGVGQLTLFVRKIDQSNDPFPHTTTLEYYLPIQEVNITN